MSRMKLYAHAFSNNSMRSQPSLDEKHLDYEYVKVDLFKGEHKKPAYLTINPRGQVPALVDGEVKIYESTASTGIPSPRVSRASRRRWRPAFA